MSTLSHRHGWTLRQDDSVACTCTPANPKHDSGYKCITDDQVAAWRAGRKTLCSDSTARIIIWLERDFGGKR